MLLYIYMNGGSVDLSKLDKTEKDKIILVYPKTEEASKNPINIFPNPATEQLSIYNADHESITSINFYSLNGQLVETQTISIPADNIQINLMDVPPGLYALRVITSNGSYTNKLVID